MSSVADSLSDEHRHIGSAVDFAGRGNGINPPTPEERAKGLSAGLIVLGVIFGVVVALVVYYCLYRCYRRIKRVGMRTYLDLGSTHDLAISSWPRPPPAYERGSIPSYPGSNVGSVHSSSFDFRVPRVHIRDRAEPINAIATPIEHPQAIQCPFVSSAAGPIKRFETQRDVVINLDRQQTLMKLEGNPSGGNHTTVIAEEDFRSFAIDMQSRDSKNRQPSDLIAELSVRKPEPLKLRGGGEEDHPVNSPWSADDINRRVKEWYKDRNKSSTKAKVKPQKDWKGGHWSVTELFRKRHATKQQHKAVNDHDETFAILRDN